MIGLNANGERTQALQAYQTLRAGMLDELGLEPGGETQDLYLSILRGNPAERRPAERPRRGPHPARAAAPRPRGRLGMFSGLPSMAEVGQLLLARAG